MDIREVKQILCGPMIPVITHLKADLSVDPVAIEAEVNYLVEHGIRSGQGVLLAVGAGGDFNMLGGTGFITHLATIWPEHDIAVWKLLETGDYVAAQQKIMAVNWLWGEFRAKMARRTSGESPPVKAALDLVGRYGGPSRLPSRSLTQAEREELRQLLLQMGVVAIS